MDIEEIKQAIIQLPQDELARFRDWFTEYESNSSDAKSSDSEQFRATLKRLRGSLKGTGALKNLMKERRKESLL